MPNPIAVLLNLILGSLLIGIAFVQISWICAFILCFIGTWMLLNAAKLVKII